MREFYFNFMLNSRFGLSVTAFIHAEETCCIFMLIISPKKPGKLICKYNLHIMILKTFASMSDYDFYVFPNVIFFVR